MSKKEDADAIIPAGTAKNLANTLYDKRKLGALEVEQLVRELHSSDNKVSVSLSQVLRVALAARASLSLSHSHARILVARRTNVQDGIAAVIQHINAEFVQSTNGNAKKGGLIAFAAIAIGLGASTGEWWRAQ